MKRIIILCDGTWNTMSGRHTTHVAELKDQFPDRDANGVRQVCAYFEGVGTSSGKGGLFKGLDKLAGGAFGLGLNQKILLAYNWLAGEYTPGDEIFILGFSRGAYTARSLGGLIRASGLPTSATRHRIPEAFKRYRSEDAETEPKTEASHAFRWGYSPEVFTGEEERKWRIDNDHPVGTELTITYMGIWDTVGALGVPGVISSLLGHAIRNYRFHDANLSRSVRAGRHAIAVDEVRPFYEPAIWKNLHHLNTGRTGTPYRQAWFAGDHGMVGGSGPSQGLSAYTLDWILTGAIKAGLEVDPGFLAMNRARRGFGDKLSDKGGRLFKRARKVNQHAREVSLNTVHRLAFGGADGTSYDPKTLRPLKSGLAPHLPDQRDPNVP